MSERKRKRDEESRSERPNKKVATVATADNVKVSVVQDIGEWPPIIASTPGLSLPSKVAFKPYKKRKADGRAQLPAHSTLLLHSSSHPTIDYTAQEESSSTENHLNHYIGIYDSANGKLKLVPARSVTVRRTLRQNADNGLNEGGEDSVPNPLSARSALGLAFGTKKSQKAIHSLSQNNINASPGKSLQGSPQKSSLDPATAILLDTMAASATSILTREDMQNEADQAKPIPKPNLNAESPADVYPIERLVGLSALRKMAVQEWIDKVEAGEEIVTKSRFISSRVVQMVKRGDVKLLKAFKYLLLLLEWHLCLKTMPKGGRKVPNKEDVARAIEWVSNDLLEDLSKRFAEASHLNKWHTQYLQTHICALALTIDNFTTDTHDLCADLHTDIKDLTKLYKELGCKVSPPTDSERAKFNLKHKEGGMRRFARLRLPLQFPALKIAARRSKGVGKGMAR